MRIVKLIVQNFKKISALEIKPNSDTVIISGVNGSGKSSALDSIWWALSGSMKVRGNLTKMGEDEANVFLDLGELTVDRTMRDGKSVLHVQNKDGSEFRSPQAMLKTLLGDHSMEPMELYNLPKTEQINVLLHSAGLADEVRKMDEHKGDLELRRRDINRDIKRIAIRIDQSDIPDNLPDQPIDTGLLATKLSDAQQINYQNQRVREKKDNFDNQVLRSEQQITTLQNEIEYLKRQLDDIQEKRAAAKADADGRVDVDTQPIIDEIASATGVNDLVARRDSILLAHAELAELKGDVDLKNRQLTEIKSGKAMLLAQTKWPVKGLQMRSSDDSIQIELNGIDISQWSSAEKLKVGTALAIAQNPQIRVLRISDGSLLDADNLDFIRDIAKDHDFQIWIEVVDDSKGNGYYIEDGELAS